MDKVIYVNETTGQIVPSTYPNAVRYVRQEDSADNTGVNKFYTGKRWVVFDSENLVIDGQSLIDYDTMIKSVPAERLLTIDEWRHIIDHYNHRWDGEKKGLWLNEAVFLPAAGYRYGTSVYSVGSHGGYWSSTCSNSHDAWYVCFGDSGFYTDYLSYRNRGRSVRLVRGVEPDNTIES